MPCFVLRWMTWVWMFPNRPRMESVWGKSLCLCRFGKAQCSWDGAVTTCTRDSHLMNRVLGSLAENPFSTLWFNESMRTRRAAVAKGDYSKLKVCQTCFIPRSLNYTNLVGRSSVMGDQSMIGLMDRVSIGSSFGARQVDQIRCILR